MSIFILLMGYLLGCVSTSLMVRYKLKKQLKSKSYNPISINYRNLGNLPVDVSSIDNNKNN